MKMAFKQTIPNVEETSLAASGKYTGKVVRGSDAYKALVSNFNTDIVFRDDEKTGDDRRMTPVSNHSPVVESILSESHIYFPVKSISLGDGMLNMFPPKNIFFAFKTKLKPFFRRFSFVFRGRLI